MKQTRDSVITTKDQNERSDEWHLQVIRDFWEQPLDHLTNIAIDKDATFRMARQDILKLLSIINK